jgi:site-specific DNA recombinase
MLRAALYARYSTDSQSPASVADQLRECRRLASRLEASVVAELDDAGVSGSSMANRPGLATLLALVEAGGCDLVIAEHTNRIARAGEDGWGIFHRLRELGVRYVTVEEGQVTVLHQGLSSLLSEQKLEEASHKTRRGLAGVALSGRSAGGRSYGYRPKRLYDAAGERLRGELEIDEAEQLVVERIFREYAAGAAPRAIVARLNAEGVPGPRGGPWNASTLNGNVARGNGVLHNELYIGWRVWGRHAWIKDRRTGKRRARAGDPANAVRVHVPELAIVDADLWAAAQARHAEVSAGPMTHARRPKHLLSGLVRCGCCAGPMIVSGAAPHHFICSARRERGPAACANGRNAPLPAVEARIVDAVREGLLHPDVIENSIEAYRVHADADRLASGRRRAELERQLAEAKRRAARLVDQVADGMLTGAAVKERVAELEADRADAERELATIAAAAAGDVVTLLPNAAREYGKIVAAMQGALEGPEGLLRDEARQIFRRLVRQVTITPLDGRGQFALAMSGDLADLLRLNEKAPRPEPGGLSSRWVRGQDLNL